MLDILKEVVVIRRICCGLCKDSDMRDLEIGMKIDFERRDLAVGIEMLSCTIL